MEQYIHPFINVCKTVFLDFCQTEIKAGRVFFLEKKELESNWDISGIIGLSGEVSGAVAISMKAETAFKVTKILTGTEHNSFDADVTDAVGEIINIITGNVKKEFEEDLKIKISLPSIVQGPTHSIIWPSQKTRIICIHFLIFDNQEIYLSVAIEPSK